MRKKLHLEGLNNSDIYVKIIDGKIRELEGYNLMKSLITGKYSEFELFETKADFTLEKTSKYDQKKLNIKANYKIESHFLLSKLVKDCYVKLNIFEKFFIDYSKKESILHKMNMNQRLIGLIVISIPLLFIGGFIKSCFFQNNKNEKTQSIKPDLTIKSQDTGKAIVKEPIHSNHIIEFERDSLHLQQE